MKYKSQNTSGGESLKPILPKLKKPTGEPVGDRGRARDALRLIQIMPQIAAKGKAKLWKFT